MAVQREENFHFEEARAVDGDGIRRRQNDQRARDAFEAGIAPMKHVLIFVIDQRDQKNGTADQCRPQDQRARLVAGAHSERQAAPDSKCQTDTAGRGHPDDRSIVERPVR